jgi:hypothetical protein
LSKLEFDTLIPGHGDPQSGKTYLRALMKMLETVQTQMKAAVSRGLDLDAARAQIDVSEFEKAFIGDDPVRRYYFRQYFFNPSTQQAFTKATQP